MNKLLETVSVSSYILRSSSLGHSSSHQRAKFDQDHIQVSAAACSSPFTAVTWTLQRRSQVFHLFQADFHCDGSQKWSKLLKLNAEWMETSGRHEGRKKCFKKVSCWGTSILLFYTFTPLQVSICTVDTFALKHDLMKVQPQQRDISPLTAHKVVKTRSPVTRWNRKCFLRTDASALII